MVHVCVIMGCYGLCVLFLFSLNAIMDKNNLGEVRFMLMITLVLTDWWGKIVFEMLMKIYVKGKRKMLSIMNRIFYWTRASD